jgi:hypothetical protein
VVRSKQHIGRNCHLARRQTRPASDFAKAKSQSNEKLMQLPSHPAREGVLTVARDSMAADLEKPTKNLNLVNAKFVVG